MNLVNLRFCADKGIGNAINRNKNEKIGNIKDLFLPFNSLVFINSTPEEEN